MCVGLILCNFACVYCGPHFSSRSLSANEVGVSEIATTYTRTTTSSSNTTCWSQAPKRLRHVYLAGGEPLLMKENLELLDRLNPEVNLRINTNLSKTNTQVFERICEFKNVHWTVSVESMHEEFEYIRYGGSWQDFQTNLNHIQKLEHRISFNMIWFVLNAFSIFDCIDWLHNNGFHANSFVAGALLGPEYLNIRHLPESVLQLLQIRIKDKN
jgi:MoaA/NifB/PqqE/SkfB family radical SAM enzyme